MEDKKEEQKAPVKKLPQLKVTFGTLNERNREILCVINKLCLPVVYSADFYLSLALAQDNYCRLGCIILIPSIFQRYTNRWYFLQSGRI